MQKAILRCIGWFCSMLLVLAVVMPAAAQATIVINNVNATCAAADVTYTIDGEIAQGNVLLSVFAGEQMIGSTSAENIGGTHTVNVDYVAQVNGTLLVFRVTDDVTMGIASAVCEGSETPPVENPPPDETSEESAPPPWEGYSDGRLNPDQGEYYTVYCLNGFLSIWRSVPVDEEIKRVPLATVFSLVADIPVDLGDNMSMLLTDWDTVTIYGSNGNLAPAAGSKAFSDLGCDNSNTMSQAQENNEVIVTDQENSVEDELSNNSYEQCVEKLFGNRYSPLEECRDFFGPLGTMLLFCNQSFAIIPTIVVSFGLFRRKRRRSSGIAQ
jgi:hypothetical protein